METFVAKSIEFSYRSENISLMTRKAGKGETIIFLHGWAHDRKVWSKVMGRLSDSYSVVSIDMPGFGDSSPIDKSLITIDVYSEIIEKALSHLLTESDIAAIVSDSLGGLVILNLLSKSIVQADSYLISGCPYLGIRYPLTVINFPGLIRASLSLLQSLPKTFSFPVIRLLSYATFKNVRDVEPNVINAVLKADPLTAELLFKEIGKVNYQKSLNPEIHGKTVIVRGKYDRVVSLDTVIGLAELLKGEWFEIPDSGHTPMIENPEAFIQSVKSLL